MDKSASSHASATPLTLSQSGENLVLVNPKFFVHEEEFRKKIQEAAARNLLILHIPKDFPQFKKLPPELRRIIWRLAGSEPRAVEFEYYPKQRNMRSKFPSKTIVPAILHTSHEARAFGLEVYDRLNFGRTLGCTFINWEVDIVLFQDGLRDFLDHEHIIHNRHLPAYTYLRPEIGSAHSIIDQKCQRLAIHWKDFAVGTELKACHFSQLKQLVVVNHVQRIGTYKDGNTMLVPEDPKGGTISLQQEADLTSLSPQRGYGLTALEKKILDMLKKHPRITKGCVMNIHREQHRLMTPAEKKARKDVQQGRKTVQEAQALKETLYLPLDGNKWERNRKKKIQDIEEQKRRRFEDDLILAAK